MKDVHGIKGNIYVGGEPYESEERIFGIVQKIVLGLFCLTATAVLIAQIIMHS